MEIELIKNTIIEGVPHETGALVSASSQNAEKLIQRGFAKLPEKAAPVITADMQGRVFKTKKKG